jgi:hypothetical protein
MTLQLNLSPDVEQRLKAAAQSTGVQPEDYALQVLQRDLTTKSTPDDAVALLQSWIDHGDAEQQRRTYEYLTRVLDEDRPADRKLFPSELKGVTW